MQAELPQSPKGPATRVTLREAFLAVRAATEQLAAPLSAEDQILQSMPSASPVKWHRAHTTWFFETFLLLPRGMEPVDPSFARLYNSYYVSLGPRHSRAARGLLSRPSCDQVADYRRRVDSRVQDLLEHATDTELRELEPLVLLGLAHEEQHQELLLTDVLSAFAHHPDKPAIYSPRPSVPASVASALAFVEQPSGLHEIGMCQPGFSFDNEQPSHRVFLEPFALANRLVSVGEWKAFADAGGYRRPQWWLSDGFDWLVREGIDTPLYARREGAALIVYDHFGEREANDDDPVTHLSHYEADAIARFMGARLPTEAEWEVASRAVACDGNFREDGHLRAICRNSPGRSESMDDRAVTQMFGDAWEWTQSAYAPYPGYAPGAGALGEYNGKFMANQLVLRGGSALSPRRHLRPSYRNFWYPDTRFQLTGVRLARSLPTRKAP